jgi:hypothetical protein
MNKFTHLCEFLGDLFDDDRDLEKAQAITSGILKAGSCRMSEIAREMEGSECANYKCIQRFVRKQVLKSNLLRLFQEEASFLIGDPTEMPRPEARKTEYVGTLSDGQTSGYWLLILATPYHGRAIPCHFVSYSSAIIGAEVTSRNRYHYQAFAEVKDLLGDKPLVLDREFSYLELMQALVEAGTNPPAPDLDQRTDLTNLHIFQTPGDSTRSILILKVNPKPRPARMPLDLRQVMNSKFSSANC